MGCWISYGLGSLNENLPTFVVLPDHRGLASNGSRNWDSTFLPARHQGTVIYPGQPNPITDLFPARQGDFVTRAGGRCRDRGAGRAQSHPRRPAARRRPARSPHPQL